jgi:hypothetical protein
MADQHSTSPGVQPGVLQERIHQLGSAVWFLRLTGQHDMAHEVEEERNRLRRMLAASGAAPELTVAECVELLQAVFNALDVPADGDETEARALLVERAAWARTTIQAFLDGKQDASFTASFLTAQTTRLQPGATLGPSEATG